MSASWCQPGGNDALVPGRIAAHRTGDPGGSDLLVIEALEVVELSLREQGAVNGREKRISGTLCLHRAVGTPRLGREVHSGEDVHVGAARLLTRYLARAVVIYDPWDELGTVAYGAYLGDAGYLVRCTYDADDPEFRGACKDVLHASGVAIGKVPASVTLVVVVALGHDAKLESQQPLEGISVIKARDADILAHHKVNGHLADALEVCQASGIGEVVGHASVMVADDDGSTRASGK